MTLRVPHGTFMDGEIIKTSETRRPHKVTIDNRERLSVTSVVDMDSFNENEVIFLTGAGMMTVSGKDLHITKLSLDDGVLVIDGKVESLDYSDHEAQRSAGSGIFSKVFR